MSQSYHNLLFRIENKVCYITLNRPGVHNAFNSALIEELRSAFAEAASRSPGEVRAIVLAGAGRSFCAGADVKWMRESLDFTEEENIADALRMARMFDTIDSAPLPVIGRIQGAALGGGVGLAAVCDIVIAAKDALFAFSEAKLGILPSVISPYVLSKVGRSHARALFLTAERFSAERALQIGLAHIVVEPDGLDAEVERIIGEVMSSAPGAISRAKELITVVPALEPEDAMQMTAETIAAMRVSSQGQEGLRAFLEKRKPEWS